jgi:dUTP pyrophosphatase
MSATPNRTVRVSTSQPFSTLDENAGYDLRSNVDDVILANSQKLIATDLKLEMPNDMYAQVMPRSGLALKSFIDTKGGVIDSGYRNYVGVILQNYGTQDFVVNKGDRIAQLIFLPIYHPTLQFVESSELSESNRGEKGYGSSGVN